VFQWHSDTFTLPHAAVHLAESDDCRCQAFRLYDYVYGFQFHLEADRGLIDRWVSTPTSIQGARRHGFRIDREAALAASDRYLPAAGRLASDVFGAFITRFYRFRRRLAHVSR
jgi:GMP synthase (glutamine-hydrolysing)